MFLSTRVIFWVDISVVQGGHDVVLDQFLETGQSNSLLVFEATDGGLLVEAGQLWPVSSMMGRKTGIVMQMNEDLSESQPPGLHTFSGLSIENCT